MATSVTLATSVHPEAQPGLQNRRKRTPASIQRLSNLPKAGFQRKEGTPPLSSRNFLSQLVTESGHVRLNGSKIYAYVAGPRHHGRGTLLLGKLLQWYFVPETYSETVPKQAHAL